jgi:hypothetical protein
MTKLEPKRKGIKSFGYIIPVLFLLLMQFNTALAQQSGTFWKVVTDKPADCNNSNGQAHIDFTGQGSFAVAWDISKSDYTNQSTSASYANSKQFNSLSGRRYYFSVMHTQPNSPNDIQFGYVDIGYSYISGVTISQSNSTCGSVTLSVSYSYDNTQSFTYSYQWYLEGNAISGATGQTYSAATSGNYSCTVSNSGGCSASPSASTSVTVSQAPTASISASGSTSICSGNNVTLTANPSTGTYSYQWYVGGNAISGATSATYTTGAAGTYTVALKNTSTGCQGSQSGGVTVTVNSLPTVSATGGSVCSGSTVACSGSPSGGTWGGSYINSSTGVFDASGLSAGNYSVTYTYTNSNGCTASANATVTVNALPSKPSISAGGSTTFCSGGSVTLSAPSASSYLWSNNATTQSITVSASGNYSVKVYNSNGCESPSSDAATVTVNPLPQASISTNDGTEFCDGGSATLNATSTNGGDSYVWYNGSTQVGTGSSYSATASGTYTAVATNSSTGCSGSASNGITITVDALPSKPSISAGSSLNFCDGGSVTLNAPSATSYLWSNNATTQSITVSASGNYSVKVYNSNGCESPSSDAVTVTVNPLPQASISTSDATEFCDGGSATLNATSTNGGDSYVWYNGSTQVGTGSTYSATASGTYTAVATNSTTSCSGSASNSITITVDALPSKPSVSADGATTFCDGGSVTLSAPSSSSYLWSNNATTQSITVSASGNYSVKVYNSNGCESPSSDAVTVTVNPLPQASISTSDATEFCDGGSATLNATSTNGGDSYVWYNGSTQVSTGSTYSATASGTYTAVATNSTTGCSGSASNSITITVNPLSTASISTTDATEFCDGGSAALSVSSDNSDDTYTWYNGSTQVGTGSSYTATTSGTYTAVATTVKGCAGPASNGITITVDALPSKPSVSASGATTFCSGGSVTLSAPSSSSYLWSNNATTQSITVSDAGSYSVKVYNSNGCESPSSDAVTVSVNPLPVASISTSDATEFCDGGSATLSASSDNGGDSYVWYNGSTQVGTGSTYSATASGTYTAVATNSTTGCSGSASNGITVTVDALPSQPSISASGSLTFCSGGSVTLTASSAASYLWSNNATTQSITVTDAGDYTVTTYNALGCASQQSATYSVIVNPLPDATISASSATSFCNGGSVVLNASSGDHYQWYKDSSAITGATGQSYTASASGSYYVQVFTALGCSKTSASTTVTVWATASSVITYNYRFIITNITKYGKPTLSGATAPTGETYSYAWYRNSMDTLVGSSQTYSTSTPGKYYLKVTSAHGCYSISSVYVVRTTAVFCSKPNNDKVSVCHNGGIICVDDNSLQTHLDLHGDVSALKCPGSGKVGEDDENTASFAPAQDNSATNLFNIYPNPTSSTSTVEVAFIEAQQARVELMGMDGKVISQLYSGSVDKGNVYHFTVDANTLSSGIYFVRVVSENNISVKKIAVQK